MNSTNNSKPEINFNDIINNVKIQSPVAFFNFDINEKLNLSVIGLYLISLHNDELKEMINEKAITDNINENTVLFFNTHHIIELSNIINGCFNFMIWFNYIDENFKNNEIFKLIKSLNEPIKYKDLIRNIDSMLDNFRSHFNASIDGDTIDIIFDRLKNILYNVWFIPYNVLDEFSSDAIDNYVNNNESEAKKFINDLKEEEILNERNGETT